jgi:hypothetical protein
MVDGTKKSKNQCEVQLKGRQAKNKCLEEKG